MAVNPKPVKLNKVYRHVWLNGNVEYILPIQRFKNGSCKILVIYDWDLGKCHVERCEPFDNLGRVCKPNKEVLSTFKAKRAAIAKH